MLWGLVYIVRIGSSPVSPTKKIQKYITNACFSRIYYVNLYHN